LYSDPETYIRIEKYIPLLPDRERKEQGENENGKRGKAKVQKTARKGPPKKLSLFLSH
jgi:hypothetical protein